MFDFRIRRRQTPDLGQEDAMAKSPRIRIVVGPPKTPEEFLLYGPKETVICGRHTLTEIQIDTLLGVLVANAIQPTLQVMNAVAQLSPAPQLRCFPRSASWAEWAFGEGIEAYFRQQSEQLERQLGQLS